MRVQLIRFLESPLTFPVPVFLISLLLMQCSIFHPGRMAEGAFFITEKEMAGDFNGERLIFDARDSLVGTARVHRTCAVASSGDQLQCRERIEYNLVRRGGRAEAETRVEERSFSVNFRYISERIVELRYHEDGAPPFNLAFFQGGEASGAGIRLFGGTLIPLSNVPCGLELRIVREDYVPPGTLPEGARRYFENRIYSYFGFQYGHAETRWEREG